MGIETNWVKGNPEQILNIAAIEWQKAQELAKDHIKKKKVKLPYKLSRKELQKQFPEHAKLFTHSFVVVSDAHKGFKLGALARSKIYQSPLDDTTHVHEGVLGHGAFGVAKIVQWQNGSKDAIKIEGATQEAQLKAEAIIMKKLGYLKTQFVMMRKERTDWIGNKKIKDKKYTIQTLHQGKEMKDYLASVAFSKLSSVEKYNMAIECAMAIKGLHDKNILHCDIKPANFMIDVKGNLFVVAPIDFGLSQKFKPGETIISGGPASGSPRYMAPEIAKWKMEDGKVKYTETQGIYSRSSDIFALGKMLIHDLKLAEDDSPLQSLAHRMINSDPNKRPTITEVVAALVEPNNYRHYEKIYGKLGEYQHKKKIRDQTYMPLKAMRIRNKTQIKMVDDYTETLKDLRLKKIDLPTATQNILVLIKENQNRHDKITFARASKINLEVIQQLPAELKQSVLKELKIPEDSKFLQTNSHTSRSELAKIIKHFKPQADVSHHSPKRPKKA
jgi:serine/threonine protein kinase